MDPESKRDISEDNGDSKKISEAQYKIFRQAVSTSKGSFKLNPAKTKRASRASLLDLGDTEVTDRISWLDQPSLQDTMASTARIAQGLKEDAEVVKTTLSETLNSDFPSFKFFTVKQIFPREPYSLKIHRDALYAPKPPGDHGFSNNKAPSSYHMSHRVCLDTEELARRSAIYASLADSMVASVIEELSPKDERTKLSPRSWPLFKFPRFRQALQPRQTCSYCVETLFWRTSTSSPKFLLLCGRHRLRGTMWCVPNQRSFRIVSVPSDKPTWWLARLGRFFRRSRLCPALAESAGQLPGHQHRRGRGGHCIPATTSAHPSKHQFPDQEQPTRSSASRRCLADEGSHRASHQREVPGILQSVVSGSQEDRRSTPCNRPVHSQPPHGGTWVRPICHQKSGVEGDDRHTGCLSSCTDASGCPQVSAFRGQQEGVPVHLSSVWTGDFSTGVHQAAETRRVAVKAGRCEATRLLRWLADQSRYSGTSSTARPDNHQSAPVSWLDHQLREVRPHSKSRLPVHRDAVQHSTFHSGAPTENAFKGPVSSSALVSQSEHNCQRSAQASRHAGVHGFAGPARTAPSSSSPMVGRHSMVPEDRELVRPDSSSTVGSVRSGMVVIPSSPARSTPRHQGDGSNSLHRWVQFGLGSPVRLTLDTGTVISISTIVPHKRSGDAGCHLCCERLPTSAEVPSGEIDVHNIQADSLPESARLWPRSGRWPQRVYDLCSPSGASHGSTCLRHSPTDD